MKIHTSFTKTVMPTRLSRHCATLHPRSPKAQAGFTTIELIVGLTVLAAASISSGVFINRTLNAWHDRGVASDATIVASAASAWLNNNAATVVAQANPTATYPLSTFASYLPASFTATQNFYGQQYSLRVYQSVANQLDAAIVTTGGQAIPEGDLHQIANMIGGAGGFVSNLNAATAQGTSGAWNINWSQFGGTPGGGHVALAMFVQNAATTNGYLYRSAVAGEPQLNEMNTAIGMNGNNINDAGTVTAVAVAASGVSIEKSGDAQLSLNNDSILQNGNMNYETNGTHNFGNDGFTAWAPIQAGSITANGTLTVTGNTTMGANTEIYNPGTQYIETGNGSTLYLKPWTAGTTYIGGGGGSGNLTATGTVSANNLVTNSGNGLSIGGSILYGDGYNLAARQNGSFYVQTSNGSGNADVIANDYYDAAAGEWVSQMTVPSGTVCGMVSNGGAVGNWCQGYNPAAGCPPGYSQYAFLVNFGNGYMYWCSKN